VNGVHVFRKQDAPLKARGKKHIQPSSRQSVKAQPINQYSKKQTQSSSSPAQAQTGPQELPQAKATHPDKILAETEKINSCMVQYQAADKLFQERCYEEARTKLQELLAGNDLHNAKHFKTKVLALLAEIHANEGNLEEARNLGEQAIAMDKLNTGYYYFLATVCQEQGDNQEAVRLLKQSLYLDHDFVLAHFQLASLVTDRTEAKKYLKNTLSLLSSLSSDELIPGSGGLTAGRLRETAQSMLDRIGN